MKGKSKILIADDSEINRSMLADMLCQEYEILEASNGLEAIAQINQYCSELSLVLLDIVMPLMDGFGVLATMNKSKWIEKIPVIIISAEASSIYIDNAYDLGAMEYINRPFDPKTVKRRVKNTVMLYSKQKLLENMLTEQMLEKEKNNLIMVEVLSHIVEFRNGESGMHVLNIRAITEILLKHLAKMTNQYDLSYSRISLIANAATLHDIGKISIDEEILNKPGRLTPEEYEVIKSHSAIGAQMLQRTSYFKSEELVQVASDICNWHHERYDGSGYPDGLVGNEIPIEAQVVALADVYDALTHERVYKKAWPHAKALSMIQNGECGAFNPLLLKCLMDTESTLERELKMRSPGQISQQEIQEAARNLLQSGKASNRTLALLEQERIKYQLFASMSREIQFEYINHTDMLTMSEWGANELKLATIITNPEHNEELQRVFAKEDYINIRDRIRAVTPDNPIVTQSYCLNVSGNKRWHKIVARPLWVEDESSVLTGVIGKCIDIHEERLEMDKLKQMAMYDSLTGLYNREYSCQLIMNILRCKEDAHNKFAMLLFDLDLFKTANDQYGHMFGDKVLGYVANKVKSCIRDTDIAARIGGDEFLIFMEFKDDVLPLVQRLFMALNGEYQNYIVAASMGVAVSPDYGTGYEELFLHADHALYAAKKKGRNCYCFYDESMKDLLSVLSPLDSEMVMIK